MRLNRFGFVLIMIFICICSSCTGLYKAGNVIALDYPIQTRLRTEIIMRFIDTLIIKDGYRVPNKWADEKKLVELDSINHVRIYFKSSPEEMYLLSFGGMLVLNDVYNPQIRSGDWVAREDLMPKNEEQRIKMRFKQQILDTIEIIAKSEGLPDSVIFKD